MKLIDKNILFLEDDEFVGDIITRHIENAGAKCLWAKSGDDALALLRGDTFDILLTDLDMKGINGVDVIKAVRNDAHTSSMPILVLTNLASDDPNVIEAGSLGVSGFFFKSSTSFEDLIKVIAKVTSASQIILEDNYN